MKLTNIVIELWNIYALLNLLTSRTYCEHREGTWKSDDFFLFISKFGVQKTDLKKLDSTQGFFYGNITSKDKLSKPFTLVVVDSEYFLEFYRNVKLQKKSKTELCRSMFRKIDRDAFDRNCHQNGTEDFLRKIPCPTGSLCVDEDTPSNVVPGFQFTYKIRDTQVPRFWYISLVSCYRNTTNNNCSWVHNSEKISIDYNIWLVNGDPQNKHLNPFEHQFSFEEHDIFETFLVFLGLYVVIIPFYFYVYSQQKHFITKLLLCIVCKESVGILFNFIHVAIFAANGTGFFVISVLGNAIDTIAQCLFMLCLLLIAKGWMITQHEMKGKKMVFLLWGIYTLLNCVLFIWNLTEIDVISNRDEWQTWPGYLICGFRLIIMVWFVVELRRTFQSSRYTEDRLQFLQQFGAYFLVWFIYLPVLAIINTQFSALWKKKIVLSITNGADLLSYLILLHLLWPSRSILYLLRRDNPLPYDLLITGILEDDDQEERVVFKRNTRIQHAVKEPNHNTIKNGFHKMPKLRLKDEKELALIEEEEL